MFNFFNRIWHYLKNKNGQSDSLSYLVREQYRGIIKYNLFLYITMLKSAVHSSKFTTLSFDRQMLTDYTTILTIGDQPYLR